MKVIYIVYGDICMQYSTVPSAMDTVAISKNVYQPLPQDNLKAKT